MIDKLSGVDHRKRNELLLVALCILFFISRAAIPFLKFPFLAVFLASWIYIFVRYRNRIMPCMTNLINSFLLILLLLIYLIAAFLLSDKIFLTTAKEIFNVFILVAIFFIMRIVVEGTSDLKVLKQIFLWLSVILAVLVSIERIYYFLYVSSYSDQYDDLYLHLSRDIVDSNFALIPVFFGAIAVMNTFLKKMSRSDIIIYTALLLLFSIAILFSGSKRGAFLFFIILTGNSVIQPASIFWNGNQIKLYSKNIRLYVISLFSLIIVSVFLVLYTSVYFKNRVLEVIEVKNISYTKNLVSETISKYVHFLNKDLNETIIYTKVWHPVFDPKDPEAWYGNGNYRVQNKLSGKNIEIVPSGSKGYLLDKSCLGFASSNHSYLFLSVKDEITSADDSINASVYCYVSDEFDGNGAALRAEGSVTGNPDQFYDLTRKGCWQKLILRLKCTEGKVKFYLYMNKAAVKDFSGLKGYVIFAYPEIIRISARNIVGSYTLTNRDIANDIVSIKRSGYDDNQKTCLYGMNKKTINSTSMVFPAFCTLSASFSKNEGDPIRNWFARLISEDTTYHAYKANLVYKKAEDNFGEDRTGRWKFAIEIFNKEYNLKEKVFGGGFTFLNWYGKCFLDDKTKTDYPHNPFLHVLLYSGMLGLAIYMFLIGRVFYLYIRYFRDNAQYFILFILTFYFTFFSGGNPFDPPVMGFFVMLPFFIHSIYRKEQNQQSKAR
jgi:hypothetical protein